jgi:hypothetical protein
MNDDVAHSTISTQRIALGDLTTSTARPRGGGIQIVQDLPLAELFGVLVHEFAR